MSVLKTDIQAIKKNISNLQTEVQSMKMKTKSPIDQKENPESKQNNQKQDYYEKFQEHIYSPFTTVVGRS